MTKHQNFIETKEYKRFVNFAMLVSNINILGSAMVNLVSEKLYLLGITQIGILLKSKLIIEGGKI